MQIFVSEFVTGGGWQEGSMPDSLLREGRAMAAAFIADCRRIPGARVVSTWDARLGPCPWDDALIVSDRRSEAKAFAELAARSDVTVAIAPETDGILTARRECVDRVGGRFAGPSRDCIALCSDKLATAAYLERHGVATIPTTPCDFEAIPAESEFPLVVKPRDGAGSQTTYLIRNHEEFRAARDDVRQHGDATAFVRQPYVPGTAVSVSAIMGDETIELFPAGVQHLSGDGRFRYGGGSIPLDGPARRLEAVAALVRRCCAVLPGARGYFGFDVICSDADEAEPRIVDINPRLTTSYLGYRQLTTVNLAERILFPDRTFEMIAWERGPVAFEADGTLLPADHLHRLALSKGPVVP